MDPKTRKTRWRKRERLCRSLSALWQKPPQPHGPEAALRQHPCFPEAAGPGQLLQPDGLGQHLPAGTVVEIEGMEGVKLIVRARAAVEESA